MTDALLPAAPQPLEKEGDDYFRKVSGESADRLCSLSLRSALKGLAAGVSLDRKEKGGDQQGWCGPDGGEVGSKGDCAGLGAPSRW